MMAYYGFAPSLAALILPVYVLLATATALAVGLWSAALAVRFRDLSFAVSYGLQAWMYATPVAYTASLIPERWQLLYQLNPVYWVTVLRWIKCLRRDGQYGIACLDPISVGTRGH